jgi:transforming growth factor-beta-induced protein
MRKWSLILITAAVAAVAVLAPAASARPAAGEADIVTTAVNAGQFTTLASLLQAAGLVETLKAGGPFTVLAPTDAAFAKVPKATLDALAADPAKLKAVLLYHVISGSVPSSEVVKLTSAKTLNGANVAIKVQDGSVIVNNARVVGPDVMASNGIIHVIDTVLLPPAAAAKPQNIVKTAVAAGQFKTLASLLQKAGLVKTLQGGSWTVFAPTDAAFARVPKATLASLGKNPALLKKVLLFHVVKGVVPASKVVTLNGKSAATVAGVPVKIKVSGGNVFLNGSTRVTKTDVKASNGVIHIINKVLIPKA